MPEIIEIRCQCGCRFLVLAQPGAIECPKCGRWDIIKDEEQVEE